MTEQKQNAAEKQALFWIPPPLAVELGSQLASWAQSQSSILQTQLELVRQQIGMEYGVPVPQVELRGATDLSANSYRIFVYANEVAHGDILFDHLLAIHKEKGTPLIDGIEALDPVGGATAYWISSASQERAVSAGYRVVDAASVLATHLGRVVKEHLERFIGLQETQALLDALRDTSPAVVASVEKTQLDLVDVYNVLKALLKDRVPIRDLPLILTVLADHGRHTTEIDLLVRQVRQALRYR